MKLTYPLHIQRVIHRLTEERPAPNTRAYDAWASDVRQYAKRYAKDYDTFDVLAFYQACGIPSVKGLALKGKQSRKEQA